MVTDHGSRDVVLDKVLTVQREKVIARDCKLSADIEVGVNQVSRAGVIFAAIFQEQAFRSMVIFIRGGLFFVGHTEHDEGDRVTRGSVTSYRLVSGDFVHCASTRETRRSRLR